MDGKNAWHIRMEEKLLFSNDYRDLSLWAGIF